ncbi:hypothetical protein P691DRAFT_778157 [Macrolepiota fuliginosa MF-IS2]|uniref:Uncharacterized protein n=1 Tax=Macrolepiota fuliginosa MF-IS2 TaxID=1400762 RepID=A0A9P5X874_9AGAR|nr:hypothetical protein P691DRAFT_778157 [Macrolepiota fuliginosa MF-IS2]
MADPEPVILTLLKLPPEQQLFFRLREIAEVFLHKLDHLNLAVAASQDAQAIQLLDELRKSATHQCDTLFGVIFLARGFKNRWFRLLDSLTTTPLTEEAIELISGTAWGADVTSREVGDAQKKIAQFGRDIASAAQQITAAHTVDSGAKESVILTPENTQVVTDLLAAVDESNELIRQIAEYYKDLGQQLENDVESAKSNPPTEEEVEMVRERWIGFLNGLDDISSGFGELREWIRKKPQVERVDDTNPPSPPTATATSTDQPPPASAPAGTKAITDASSPPARTKRSFLRSLPRRLFSCLRIKNFD